MCLPKSQNVPFETALDLAGFGKYNYFIFFVSFLSMLGAMTELTGLSFLVQASSCDLELTLEQRGILAGAPMIGIVLTAYFWGYVTDVKGRRSSLMISVSIGFVSSFLSSFANSMVTMTVLKFISVSFSSGASAISYTYLAEFQPKKHRDKFIILLTCGNILTEAVLVLLTYPVLNLLSFHYPMPALNIVFRPWRLLIMVYSMPLALSTICLLFTSETPKFLMAQSRVKEAMLVLRKIYTMNTGDHNYPVESILFEDSVNVKKLSFFRSMWYQCSPLFSKRFIKHTIVLYFFIFWINYVINAYAMWFPYILNKFLENLNRDVTNENFCQIFTYKSNITDSLDLSIEEICDDKINLSTHLSILVYSSIGCGLAVITAFLIKSLGNKLVLIIILILTGGSGFIIYWIYNPYIALILFIFVVYAFLGTGIISIYIVEVFPTYVRGMAVSLSFMVARMASFSGTYINGIVFEPYCDIVLFVHSLIIFACVALAFTLPNDKKKVNEKTAVI